MRRYALLVLLCLPLGFSTSCGGGAATSTTTTSNSVQAPPPPALTITTSARLPGAVQGRAYSVPLSAKGGSGPLHWSLAPISSNLTANTGLTLDATGLLSGTANFLGFTSFIAMVSDSSSPPITTTQNFLITSFAPLTAATFAPITVPEYVQVFFSVNTQGGVPPLSYSVVEGALPPGMGLNPAFGASRGAANAMGTYNATVAVQDSFSQPERVLIPITVIVTGAPFTTFASLPAKLALNRIFNGRVFAQGGTPPYVYSMQSGSLPTGLALTDTSRGIISGTPTNAGQFGFSVKIADSSSPPQTSFQGFQITVVSPVGRNDTAPTSIRVGNGTFFASISPYIDPPNGAPLPADGDYFKLVGTPGNIVRVSTFTGALSPLDTVIEIVDVNGARLNTCRLPGDTSMNFNSSCLNDDISLSPHNTDSALDFQVPANSTAPSTFAVHVFDWRGDARPDMTYALNVSGVIEPLSVQTIGLPVGNVSSQYNQQLLSSGGISPVSWSLASGNSLPPGLTLSSSGVISGTPTASGTFAFTVQASDTLPESATAQLSIQVF
jgi:putative Ig domain-containing protein